ncbi:hypothetical protein B0H15DRAFT_794186 [Mycena belliarum]|uniref:Uncharacterized protein n=1 Tax=Mycena belliarum TaxID=1033014 RepID=A0AAD6TMT9_9AGAR|nr:hypothetical protein B0H15DRAFT_794186 [Mycena belliae]
MVRRCDEVIPLGEPVTPASGEVVTRITVAKGMFATVSIWCMNRSEVFCSPDAKAFMPEWWLTLPLRAKEIQSE